MSYLDVAVRVFFWVASLVTGVIAYRFFRDMYLQYKRGAVYELMEEEHKIQEHNLRLSDDDIIRQANKGIGSSVEPPADDQN